MRPGDWISQVLGHPVEARPRRSVEEIPAARAMWDLAHLNRDLPAVAALHESVLLREDDGFRLTAEVYVPFGTGPFPTLLYLHGGSWCLWSAAHLRKFAMRFAAHGYMVVNLDYSLAPERPFPHGVDDTIFACRWVSENAGRYGGVPGRIFIAGDSAGANLGAASIAAHLSGRAPGVDVAFDGALFFYGVFDFPLLFQEPGANAATGVIETTWNAAYLGPNFIRLHRDPLVSPIYADCLDRFPPTLLVCGARDALLPQSLSMTRALVRAGVPTSLHVAEELDHEFGLLADSVPAAARELQRAFEWLEAKREESQQSSRG